MSKLDSRRLRQWSFGLLIVVPALVLALLGLRTVRADRLEREQERRDRQAQTARLVDGAMRASLSDVEHDLRARDNGTPIRREGVDFFTFDRGGRLVFPDDRLSFGAFSDSIEWPPDVARLIDEAQAAEAQGRSAQAIEMYATIAEVEPRLRVWARRSMQGPIGTITDDQVTPSGLPIALVAAPPRQALPELRAGRWWLTFEERRFYDREIGTRLGLTADPRLEQLRAIARLVIDVPRRRDEPTRQLARVNGGLTLLVMSPSKSPTSWQGAALRAKAFDRLFAGAPLAGAGVVDEQGKVITGAVFAGGHAEPLSLFPGWKVVFAPAASSRFDSRTILWLGFIALLIVTMLGSLISTIRIVRREAELARLQNDFIAGVSHEFKSPITGIRLLLERLAGGRINSPEAAARYRTAAERELTRLERHVNRLLEAQQIQAGQRPYVFAPAPLSDIVAEAVAERATQAEARHMTLTTGDAGGPAVPVDRAAMTDAIANLIDNAIKYSPAGARIQIRTRADTDHAFIDVEDEGGGIDAGDMRKIFKRFYRSPSHADVSGTGLGLALVKATVQAHGGHLSATSAPGKGSRFTIRLPLHAGSD